jgi:Fibronectin type III domain
VVGGDWDRRRSFWCALLVVVPLALGGCDSGGGEEPEGESKPAPKALLPPVGFSATADGFSVHLSWSADPASAQIENYELDRNGRNLFASTTSTSYTDTDVRPGKMYRYEIRSIGANGKSDPVVDEVKIKTPPLHEARVEGGFSITTKEISHYGYGDYSLPTFGSQFKPKCRHGACDVVWTDIGLKGLHAILEQRGAAYHGSYRGFFLSLCEGTRSTSDVEIDFKVVDARAIRGEWRAKKFEGTIEHTEAPQYGCGTAHAELAIKGLLRVAG